MFLKWKLFSWLRIQIFLIIIEITLFYSQIDLILIFFFQYHSLFSPVSTKLYHLIRRKTIFAFKKYKSNNQRLFHQNSYKYFTLILAACFSSPLISPSTSSSRLSSISFIEFWSFSGISSSSGSSFNPASTLSLKFSWESTSCE